jgi:hypothetical protein
MAIDYVSGFHGGVTLPSSIGGAPMSFTVKRNMTKKDVNIYGADRFNRSRGGIIKIMGEIQTALQFGATATDPNIVNPAANGVALTLQLEVGCTLVGTALFADLDINHSFPDPAIFGGQGYEFTGVVTSLWASS